MCSARMSWDFNTAPFGIKFVCSAVARPYSADRWSAIWWIWRTSPAMLMHWPVLLTSVVLFQRDRLCSLLSSSLFTAVAWLLAVATGGAAVELEDEAGGLDDELFVLGLGLGLFSKVTATTAPAAITAAAATSPPISAPRERFGGCCGGYGAQPGPPGPPGCG